MEMDLSTLNIVALEALETYELPVTYHLQREPGNGCFMDPPGFPTYFTRSVYTRHGNTPKKGPETVIAYDGTLFVVHDEWTSGQTWEDRRAEHDSLMLRLWAPLPLEHPRTQAWIRATYRYFDGTYEDPSVPADVRRNVDKLKSIGTPEHYRPLLRVREFYPEFAGIARPEGPRDGDWWARYAEAPAPETCPGEHGRKHPVNGSWCQVCGWSAPNETEAN